MNLFSDIHAHFVYGVDDGAQTREEMEAMLDAAWRDGVTELIATPHMTPGVYEFPEERFLRHLKEAREYCLARDYHLQLYPGAEILYTPALEPYLAEHSLPTLANSSYVLLEFTPSIPYAEIVSAVELLDRNGLVPVLAHVERYQAFSSGSRIYQLKEQCRVLYQLNGRTIIHGKGFFQNLRIQKWLRDHLIDYIATDSHNCTSRSTCMQEAYSVLNRQYGTEYANHLTGIL